VVSEGVTSRLGASYISGEAALAIASHAVLETYADHVDGHDAVFIACFGDPGLLALREIATVPVIGLAHASFVAAIRLGRFAVVTGGKAWEPMLQRFARLHQFDAQLAGVFAIDWTGAQIAPNPSEALVALRLAAMQGIASGARTIVLGGAALGGLADRMQVHAKFPVLDNVALAAHAVVDAMAGDGGPANAAPAGNRSSVIGAGAALATVMDATDAAAGGIQIGPTVTPILQYWGLDQAPAQVAAFPDRLRVSSALSGRELAVLPA